MPNSNSLQFYHAYVTNVRDFLIAECEIRRAINRALKTGKDLSVQVNTKIYALLYSTYSEATFMKLILTPYGLQQSYIDQVLLQDSIQEKWFKCLDLAFNNFTTYAKGSEIPNKKQDLKRIIQNYIISPSLIRNKIAHGQLSIAINRKNTGLNSELTSKLGTLDFITIYRWFKINEKLARIIEDLIESPDKAHYKYYYKHFLELEQFIGESKDWSIATKMQTYSMKKEVKR